MVRIKDLHILPKTQFWGRRNILSNRLRTVANDNVFDTFTIPNIDERAVRTRPIKKPYFSTLLSFWFSLVCTEQRSRKLMKKHDFSLVLRGS